MAEKRLAVVEYLQFREVVGSNFLAKFNSATSQIIHFWLHKPSLVTGITNTSPTYSQLLQRLLETVTRPVHGGAFKTKFYQLCPLYLASFWNSTVCWSYCNQRVNNTKDHVNVDSPSILECLTCFLDIPGWYSKRPWWNSAQRCSERGFYVAARPSTPAQTVDDLDKVMFANRLGLSFLQNFRFSRSASSTGVHARADWIPRLQDKWNKQS